MDPPPTIPFIVCKSCSLIFWEFAEGAKPTAAIFMISGMLASAYIILRTYLWEVIVISMAFLLTASITTGLWTLRNGGGVGAELQNQEVSFFIESVVEGARLTVWACLGVVTLHGLFIVLVYAVLRPRQFFLVFLLIWVVIIVVKCGAEAEQRERKAKRKGKPGRKLPPGNCY